MIALSVDHYDCIKEVGTIRSYVFFSDALFLRGLNQIQFQAGHIHVSDNMVYYSVYFSQRLASYYGNCSKPISVSCLLKKPYSTQDQRVWVSSVLWRSLRVLYVRRSIEANSYINMVGVKILSDFARDHCSIGHHSYTARYVLTIKKTDYLFNLRKCKQGFTTPRLYGDWTYLVRTAKFDNIRKYELEHLARYCLASINGFTSEAVWAGKITTVCEVKQKKTWLNSFPAYYRLRARVSFRKSSLNQLKCQIVGATAISNQWI